MKNEKHVALARTIVDKYYYPEASVYNELVEDIAEALASKVVGPSDEEIEAQASKYSRDIEFEHPYGDFKNGAQWLRSQLTLAPNEGDKK